MLTKAKFTILSVFQHPLWTVFVLTLLIWLLVGCTTVPAESESANAVTAEDLIIPESILPDGWEYAAKPRPMGPSAGFGDADDREIPFQLSDDPDKPEGLAYQYVLRLRDAEQAYEWYDTEATLHFGNRIFGDTPFPSHYTSNLRIKCEDKGVRPKHIQCAFLGQYNEFVIVLNAVIPEDRITPFEFEEFARRIDRFIGERLAMPLRVIVFSTRPS
ncbi:MAG: hypothetical protein WBO46_16635 [Caldilineaceae bacterium]